MQMGYFRQAPVFDLLYFGNVLLSLPCPSWVDGRGIVGIVMSIILAKEAYEPANHKIVR